MQSVILSISEMKYFIDQTITKLRVVCSRKIGRQLISHIDLRRKMNTFKASTPQVHFAGKLASGFSPAEQLPYKEIWLL